MLTCKNGCNRPVCCDDNLCLRCDGAAEKRARIVAMIREEAAKVNRGIMGKPLDAASFALNLAHAIEDGDT